MLTAQTPKRPLTILLAATRGFCAGVDRAIQIVQRALERFGRPVYVRHEIVHNRHVVEELERQGAVFVEELAEVPSGSTVIFSAHGVSKAVRAEAEARGLRVFDATCPLVTKVHSEVKIFARKGYTIVFIGHKDHDEAVGTVGEAPDNIVVVESAEEVEKLSFPEGTKLCFVTQTTLSLLDAMSVISAL